MKRLMWDVVCLTMLISSETWHAVRARLSGDAIAYRSLRDHGRPKDK